MASGEFCTGPELFWLRLECDFCFCDVLLLIIFLVSSLEHYSLDTQKIVEIDFDVFSLC